MLRNSVWVLGGQFCIGGIGPVIDKLHYPLAHFVIVTEFGSVPATRWSTMTTMRSASPTISGMSLEMSRIESPWLESSRSARVTRYFVLTSMPTVGSSMIRIEVSAASHLARLTFCWLPPERLPTCCSNDGVFTCKRLTNGATADRSALG